MRQVEVDACFAVGPLRSDQVEIVYRDLLVMLIEHRERGPAQDVVVDLLGWPAVFEDKGDGFVAL